MVFALFFYGPVGPLRGSLSTFLQGSDLYRYVQLVEEAIGKDYSTDLLERCNSSDPVESLFCMGAPNEAPTNRSEDPGKPRPPPATATSKMTILRLEKKAFKEIGVLAQDEKYGHYSMAWQPKENFIRDCEFSMGACESEDPPEKWTGWYNPRYSVCYSINTNGTYQTIRPGPMYGLTLQLNVNKAEHLPSTFAIGVRVGVDQPGTTPFPEIDGIFAPVGTATAIALSLAENRGLGRPYSDCVTEDEKAAATDPEKFYYNAQYSLTGCINTCLQRQIIEQCEC